MRSRLQSETSIIGCLVLLLWVALLPSSVYADADQQVALTTSPISQQGRWINTSDQASNQPGKSSPTPALTGGQYFYELFIELSQDETLVVDFKNSSTLEHFTHHVYDSQGVKLAELTGGISHVQPGDYFLRHGKKLELPAGSYRIQTELNSVFYLAIPTPAVYREAHYLTQLRYSQALTLIGVGIFFALAFYYIVIGIWRRVPTDLLYAGFIIGNLLFNSSAQLVFKDLFGWHWFYMVSAPILVSNIIYIGFVMALLGIKRESNPWLFKIGLGSMLLLASFWPLAIVLPNWSLEFARYGVAVFALYGFATGVRQSLLRHRVAYFYLISNAAFVLPAFIAISLKNVPITDFLLVEHIGMVAVLIEVLLLAQVMSYQIGLVYKERAEHQVAAEQGRLLGNLAEQVPGVIYQLKMSPDGKFSAPFASQGLRAMFGVTQEEVERDVRPALKQVCAEDYRALMESIAESARTMSPWKHEFRVALPGEGLRWRAGNAQPQQLADGSILWHGFISDITERKHIEERLLHMAQHDLLTNLPNRALFMDRFEHALAQAKRNKTQLTLMFVDLDDFKIINDEQGHQVGDLLLQKVAKQLSLNVRASDTAARFGGDEFVVLLQPVNGITDARTVAEKISTALKQPYLINNCEMRVTASIGIALYPDHGQSSAMLVRAADAAMYDAKKDGRDKVHHYQSSQ